MATSKMLLKQINEQCIKCNKCYQACLMLQGLDQDFKNILSNNKLAKGKNKCSLCGLCTQICPLHLDICSYYYYLKREKPNKIINAYIKRMHYQRIVKANE